MFGLVMSPAVISTVATPNASTVTAAEVRCISTIRDVWLPHRNAQNQSPTDEEQNQQHYPDNPHATIIPRPSMTSRLRRIRPAHRRLPLLHNPDHLFLSLRPRGIPQLQIHIRQNLVRIHII